MSFSTALSGLNAATADLNVKSNNIANVSTTGFKQSRAEFGDVFSLSAFGSSSSTAIGSGVVLSNVAQQFNQGNLEFTDNSLDLAISGEGFFALAPSLDSGEITYTRAGSFGIDKEGYMVNSQGSFLRTFPVDEDGLISATSISAAKPLQLPASQGAPESTTLLSISNNLPSNAAAISATSIISAAVAGTDTVTFAAPTVGDSVTIEGVVFTISDGTGPSVVTSSTAVDVQVDITGGATAGSDAATAFNAAFVLAKAGAASTALSSLSVNSTGPTTTLSDTNAGLAANVDRIVSVATTAGTAPTLVQNVTGSNAVTAATAVDINPFDSSTYNNSTSATVYDSLGNEHIVTTYYQKLDSAITGVVDNQWSMAAYITGNDIKIVGATESVTSAGATLVEIIPATDIYFNSDGSLVPVDFNPSTSTVIDPITFTFSAANGTELKSGAADQTITLDLTGSTQNSGSFSVSGLTINGFPTGRLTGVDVSDDGLIRATYSNGQAVPIGKLAMARFANPQALNKLGNTTWKETTDSGPVIAGEAGTGSFGLIQSGALETSNVDLTKELVGLITAQRNFQANSKAIETNNTITQTIINIR